MNGMNSSLGEIIHSKGIRSRDVMQRIPEFNSSALLMNVDINQEWGRN